MNLFNIKQEYLALAHQLSEGEVTPELEQALIINEAQLQEKATNYGYVIKNFEYEVDAIDNEIKRLKELKERREKAIDRMKQSVTNAMQLYGIEKVESSFLKLSFRKSESVEVINEAQLLPEFTTTKVTTTPNKVAIKSAIQSGQIVDGAIIVQKKNLQIR